jgi:hypothetical protein
MQDAEPVPVGPIPPESRLDISTLNLEAVQRMHREALSRYEESDEMGSLEVLEDAIERMPEEDLDKAREVFRGLALSDFAMDRNLVATFMPRLGRHDWPLGSELWGRLLFDRDREVVEEARDALVKAVAEQALPPNRLAEMVRDVLS